MQDRGIDSVVVTGGEPTSSDGLLELARGLKAEGLRVRIDSNGAAPLVLTTLVEEGLVDFVALDVKTTPSRYDMVTRSVGTWARVQQSIDLLITSSVEHEFRTTCYPSAVNTADLPEIASHLAGGDRFAIQQFSQRRTFDSGAASVRPYDAQALRRAALCCMVHLPTVVRGV